MNVPTRFSALRSSVVCLIVLTLSLVATTASAQVLYGSVVGSVKDAQGATVAQTETVTITGTNDAPTVTGALTQTAAEGAPSFTANLLSGASDVDDGETATLSIANVNYTVDGGTASATAPAPSAAVLNAAPC